MKKLITLLPLVASSIVMANEATIRVSDDAVSFYLDPAASATNSVQLGFLYNDDADAILLSGGLFANGQRDRFSGRLGGKLYYADLDDDSGYGIALGGDFNYTITPMLSLHAGLFYGPDSLTFSDLEGYEEWYFRVNYKVFDTASIGAGYGSLEIEDDDDRDVEVDDGVFIEMRLTFR